MLVVDVHAHLCDYMGSLPENVFWIASGYDEISNAKTLTLKSAKIAITLGFAPQSVHLHRSWSKAKEQILAHKDKIVAVGEVGLDFKWAKTEDERKVQECVFREALSMAERLSLPVVVHSRLAESRILSILPSYRVSALFHCFSGRAEEAKKAWDCGYLLSVPPRRGKERRRAVSCLPLDALVVETDLPYIGQKPEDIFTSVSYIAEVKNISEAEVVQKTTDNARRFFDLKLKF